MTGPGKRGMAYEAETEGLIVRVTPFFVELFIRPRLL